VKIHYLQEPELEFGFGSRHIDIRFGLANYGPHDIGSKDAPKSIPVGIVGIPQDVDRVRLFLDACRREIPAPKTRQPNLRPAFPGFRPDLAFHSTLDLDDSLVQTIPPKFFEGLGRIGKSNDIVREAVSRFRAEFDFLHRNRGPKVLICAVPDEVAKLLDPNQRPSVASAEPLLNFHGLLKAECLTMPPLQLMLPSTSDLAKALRRKQAQTTRPLQDEATRAWNLHTALYYKALGRPWRLGQDPKEFQTCFVGVSFYQTLDRSVVQTSSAQVFDERGYGMIVQGGPAEIVKDDRTPHLTEGDAAILLEKALLEYRQAHGHMPARVVLHKTSYFTGAEKAGFQAQCEKERIDRIDMISIASDPSQRVYRYGAYPPLRGTLLQLDDVDHLLFTRGSVPFYATYPGLYVPKPLLFRCESVQESSVKIARELLALSKLNWNRTQFDGTDPITTVAAESVGKILKYLPSNPQFSARYSHFM